MSIPVLLFSVAVFVFLLACFCGSVLYWYETLNNPQERIPPPKPGLFPCLLHYGGALISYSLCLVLVIAGPFLRRKPGLKGGTSATDSAPDPEAEGRAPVFPPIILIHGIYNNAGAWLFMARVLAKAGYSVSTYEYSSFSASLETILRGLDERVSTVLRLSGEKPVLIGHSLGGLLSRKWLADYNGSDRVRGVITLGTPHGGSKMAVFAPGALARSIRPDGLLVAALRDLPPAVDLPCVSLVSTEDEAVLPASLLLPPQGWTMRLTPPRMHFSMLFSPRVAGMVLEELRAIRSRT